MRDLAPYTELTYLNLAKNALDQGNFFALYQDGMPYTEKPPLYIWLAMGALSLGYPYAMSIMLLISVLSFIYIIIALDRIFGSEFRHQERLLIIIGMGSLVAIDFTAVRASLDLPFVALLLAAYLRIFKRYRLIVKERQEEFLHASVHPPYAKADPIEALQQEARDNTLDDEFHGASYKGVVPNVASSVMESTMAVKAMRHHVKYGNLSIPFLGFLGFLLNGLGSFLPLLATIILLSYERDLKSFFKLIRPHYFAIVAILTAMWAGLTYYVDPTYFVALMLEIVSFGFSNNFIPALMPVMPYYMVWILIILLVVPVGISSIYFMVVSFVKRTHLTLNQIGVLAFSLSVIVSMSAGMLVEIIKFPHSGVYACIAANRIVPAIAALPTFFYFVVLSYKRSQETYEESERALNHSGSELGVFVRRFREQQRSAALSGNGDVYHPKNINSPHHGLEIVGDGYFLGAISLRSDRPRLPWLLVASYIVVPFSFIALFTNFFIFSKTFPELNEPQVGTALGVLALFGIVSIIMLLSRLFLFSLAANGIGMLGMVFCLGLASPQLNSYIGFERLAFQASQAINRGGSNIVCIVGFPNGNNIKLFDDRFQVYTDHRVLDRCIDNKANVMISSQVARNEPDLALKLRSNGAFLIGDRLFLPSVSREHLDIKYAERNRSGDNLPMALVLGHEEGAKSDQSKKDDAKTDNGDSLEDWSLESNDATTGAAQDSNRPLSRSVHIGTGEFISGKYSRIMEERRNSPRSRGNEQLSTTVEIPESLLKTPEEFEKENSRAHHKKKSEVAESEDSADSAAISTDPNATGAKEEMIESVLPQNENHNAHHKEVASSKKKNQTTNSAASASAADSSANIAGAAGTIAADEAAAAAGSAHADQESMREMLGEHMAEMGHEVSDFFERHAAGDRHDLIEHLNTLMRKL